MAKDPGCAKRRGIGPRSWCDTVLALAMRHGLALATRHGLASVPSEPTALEIPVMPSLPFHHSSSFDTSRRPAYEIPCQRTTHPLLDMRLAYHLSWGHLPFSHLSGRAFDRQLTEYVGKTNVSPPLWSDVLSAEFRGRMPPCKCEARTSLIPSGTQAADEACRADIGSHLRGLPLGFVRRREHLR